MKVKEEILKLSSIEGVPPETVKLHHAFALPCAICSEVEALPPLVS